MHAVRTPIYQSEQIRAFEHLAQERFGISGQTMMQRAGQAAFDFLLKRWPHTKKIAVLCGSGNNGGDGYVVATLAQQQGLSVNVWQVGQHEKMKEEAAWAYELCQKANVSVRPFHDAIDLQSCDLIVDAICGIGLHQALRADIVAVIEKAERSRAPVFAIDIPTGIDADTGRILGKAIRASATITFIGHKLGLLTGNGSGYTGELVVSDLQLPSELFALAKPVAEKIQRSDFSRYLKPRLRDWHKGLSGHVLIVGGDFGMSGAPRMAGEAALRVGAGLVSIATRPENALVMNSARPELMCHGVSEPKQLDHLLERADVIVLGPGLGQSEWAKSLWQYVVSQKLPLLVDADGLNLLSQTKGVKENWVLTPHPGEAGRLLGKTSQAVQEDRLNAVKALQEQYGGVCVLKGAGTLVADAHSLPGLCDRGNPGMASAGQGDILSGVIGGLMGQSIPLGDAAKLGVLLHAMAGDLAAKEGERGMIAMDLMPYLRRLVNE